MPGWPVLTSRCASRFRPEPPMVTTIWRRWRGCRGSRRSFPAWRYPEPLGPVAAAQRAGLPLPTKAELIALVGGRCPPGRLVLVEGAGGLLVELGSGRSDAARPRRRPRRRRAGRREGWARHAQPHCHDRGSPCRQNVSCAGVVVGAWPAEPGAAETSNLEALDRIAPLRATLPSGAGALPPAAFAELSAGAFPAGWLRTL